jgi:hypothetical protein
MEVRSRAAGMPLGIGLTTGFSILRFGNLLTYIYFTAPTNFQM